MSFPSNSSNPSLFSSACDVIIGISYFAIPFEIAYCIRYLPRHILIPTKIIAVAVMFVLFILSCGATHFIQISHSGTFLLTSAKCVTATVSAITAIASLWILPKVSKMPRYVESLRSENRDLKDFRRIVQSIKVSSHKSDIMPNVLSELNNSYHRLEILVFNMSRNDWDLYFLNTTTGKK